MSKRKGVPVTMRALIQRVNRKLATDGEVLKTTRGARAHQELGDYYVLNVRMNAVARHDVDPEALGRRIGVLRPWEYVVADE
jgi:hypothetical protein